MSSVEIKQQLRYVAKSEIKGGKSKKLTKTPSLKKCRRDTSISDANPKKKIIGSLALCFNSRRLITSAQHTVLLEG